MAKENTDATWLCCYLDGNCQVSAKKKSDTTKLDGMMKMRNFKNLKYITHINKEIKIDPNLIQELHIGAWNSAGVINSIMNSSNQCSPILAGKGIKTFGHFCFVSGDFVQTTGHGSVLSDTHNNCSQVAILDIKIGFYVKCPA